MLMASSTANVRAAELVMFEQAGCVWCEAFDREIATVYDKTDEGARARCAASISRLRCRPILPSSRSSGSRRCSSWSKTDANRRIRGYPGEDHFWGLLGVLIKSSTVPERWGTRAITAKYIATRRLMAVFIPRFIDRW